MEFTMDHSKHQTTIRWGESRYDRVMDSKDSEGR